MIPLILLNLAGPLKEKKLSENIDIICLHNLIYLKYSVLHFPNFRPSYSAMIGIYKASVIYQREHSTI